MEPERLLFGRVLGSASWEKHCCELADMFLLLRALPHSVYS